MQCGGIFLNLGFRSCLPSDCGDVSAYFVDRLPYQGVPAYTRLDTELSWKWSKQISLSLVGQNLLKDHHLEFYNDSGATISTLVKRSVYAKIVWRF